jgi:hypothetical protein
MTTATIKLPPTTRPSCGFGPPPSPLVMALRHAMGVIRGGGIAFGYTPERPIRGVKISVFGSTYSIEAGLDRLESHVADEVWLERHTLGKVQADGYAISQNLTLPYDSEADGKVSLARVSRWATRLC